MVINEKLKFIKRLIKDLERDRELTGEHSNP